MSLSDLNRALALRFANIGEPKNIRFEAKPKGHEIFVFDDFYGLHYHAYLDPREWHGAEITKVETEVKKQSLRMRFLARKLVEDLEQARKLFVWCSRTEPAESEILKLVENLQSYGPNTLLWISGDSSGRRVGEAAYISKGLIRGYIDKLATPPATIGAVSFNPGRPLVKLRMGYGREAWWMHPATASSTCHTGYNGTFYPLQPIGHVRQKPRALIHDH